MLQTVNKALTNPQASDVHVSAPLTNFSQAWFTHNSAEYLSSLGICPVDQRFGSYYEWDRAALLRAIATVRADGADADIIGATVNHDGVFNCLGYGVRTPKDDVVGQFADAGVSYDQSLADLISEAMARREETEFAAAVMTTGWAVDTAPSVLWDVAGSDIPADIEAARLYIQKTTGRTPNRLLLGAPVWSKMKVNASILDRLGFGSNTDPTRVTRQAVAAILEVESIHVSTVVTNSANPGASESTDFVVGKHALLCHVPAGNGLRAPSAFKRFVAQVNGGSNGRRMLQYRAEPRTTWIEGEGYYDTVRTSTALGRFWNGAVS